MNLQSFLTALSIVTASLILFLGVVLLTGIFLPDGIPVNYRYTLGSVMTLYAAYRIGMVVYRLKRPPVDVGPDGDTVDNRVESQETTGAGDPHDPTGGRGT
ncbi:MAG TPA: hypothetical protein VJO14_06945 [Bacteroidota bacterium]|nr:hypothetical protein [Bacteroidota bacterium]